MKRREFIRLAGGAMAAWPLAARGQQPAMPVIGFLSGTHLDDREVGAVRRGLNESGYIEGRNVAIEYRSAEGHYDRLSELATDLVRRQVSAIIAIGGTVTALTAKAATEDIPIVFATAGDPIQLKLVSSLNRPGGNVTGVSFLGAGLGPKRLQFLHELMPTAETVGYLVNPLNPNSNSETTELEIAARMLGQEIYIQNATNERDIDTAFEAFALKRVKALLVAADAIFTRLREQIVTLAARHSIAAIYALPQFVTAGGLISYGASRMDAFRLVGVYTGKILKGEKPADLPVQQAVKIETAINLKTAKTLGIAVPPDLLVAADQVIE
jgi:putative tryptophan/tyrosine transport system substrate-binding protein